MLKKIVLGALLTGLVAVLIVGAVNRTNAKSGEGAGVTGRRGQVTASVTADAVAQGSGGRWSETETPQGATGRAAVAGAGHRAALGRAARWDRPRPGRAASHRRTCSRMSGAPSRGPWSAWRTTWSRSGPRQAR